VLLHTFSVLCVYSEFGHHPHPLGYLCVKFFRDLHCRASPWRKNAYSITHSLTQLIHCARNQSTCGSEN